MGRDKNIFKKAVVQVKGGKTKKLEEEWFNSYIDNGYEVFLFAPVVIANTGKCTIITKTEIEEFYKEYKSILPESITKWESIIK